MIMMKLNNISTLFAILMIMFSPQYVLGSVTSDPLRMRKIFRTEIKIRKLIDQLKNESGIQDISDNLNSYTQSHETVLESLKSAGLEDPFQVLNMDVKKSNDLLDSLLVGNALHCFKLMRRIVYLLNPVLFKKFETNNKVARTALKRIKDLTIKGNPDWPRSEEDVALTALAVARIQYAYQIDVSELIHGNLGPNLSTGVELNHEEVLFIARSRSHANPPLIQHSQQEPLPEFALAIEWLEAGHKLCRQNNSDINGCDEEMAKTFQDELILMRKYHDQVIVPPKSEGPSYYPNEYLFIRPIGTNLTVTGRQLRTEEYQEFRQRKDGIEQQYFDAGLHSARDFFKLCRGESLNIDNEGSYINEKCYLDNKENHPELLLQPIMVEAIEKSNLKVLIYHDVISQNEIEILTGIMEDKRGFNEAEVYYDDSAKQEKVSTARTQSNSWLEDADYPNLLPGLSRRLDLITGLQVSNTPQEPMSSEQYQVGAYGPGGLFLCHWDILKDTSNEFNHQPNAPIWSGNRIATIMFYLNDVYGGNTAFCHSGISVSPSKGSVVLWFNQQDGDCVTNDIYSKHGGCPVLYGVKWIMNKWVRGGAQIWKRPCSLSQH